MNQPDNTIPFSIEKWKAGYQAVCRDGTVPSELHYFESLQCAGGRSLVGVIAGKFLIFTATGRADLSQCISLYDLFLRPKMEKWYRRAYWNGGDLHYIGPFRGADNSFADDYFQANNFISSCKWAGPIEEFEVMAREG